jgi:hypothetical protein
LKKGSFKYPSQHLFISKFRVQLYYPLSLLELKVKIIEKALLNAIEPYFEGV